LKREIIRPGVTRFATAYLTMQSMMEKKDCLRKMVVDSKWEDLSEVKTKKGKDATATVLNIQFWRNVSLCLKIFEPLVKVLRLVDGDVKLSMGMSTENFSRQRKRSWNYLEMWKRTTEM